ncbi:MAG: PaaI family thioesterase [Oscillibacter sp.]|nr:PaaI family thioesterase [Oscillibacter sp.]
MADMDLQKLLRFRNLHNPYCQRQGIVLQDLRPGYARVTKTVTSDDVNPLNVPHGGVYFTMADNACGSAMVAYGNACVTVDASYHFLRGAKIGDLLTAEAFEVRHGNLISVLEVKITGQDGTVFGTGTFTFCSLGYPIEIPEE